MQRPEIQTRQQIEGGFKIDILGRKGPFLVPFLIVFLTLSSVTSLLAAEKKSKKPQPKPPIAAKEPMLSERDIAAQFRDAEERLKKGRAAEALKLFQSVYDLAKTGLAAMECVKNVYSKIENDAVLEQDVREEIVIKLQRIASLKTQFDDYRIESAYNVGYIYAKRGDNEQAVKYLLEVCQKAPASLDPGSLWMKAKTLLLETLCLQGEF